MNLLLSAAAVLLFSSCPKADLSPVCSSSSDPASQVRVSVDWPFPFRPFVVALYLFAWDGVDGGLADPKGRAELATEKNTYSSKKKKRRQKKPTSTPSAVQRLFETCKEVFAHGGRGFIPSADDVERLRSVLETLKLVDVGVSPNLPFFHHVVTDGPPPVTYLHLYACPNFSIGIFCLPQAAVIPLHNHPGMTAFSKLLLAPCILSHTIGLMTLKAQMRKSNPRMVCAIDSFSLYEILRKHSLLSKKTAGTCLAKVNTDAIFKAPCETSVLYPTTGGNMHCFTAVTSCAVLDVLGPPYNDDEGRACSYYKEYVFSSIPAKQLGCPVKARSMHGWRRARASPMISLYVVQSTEAQKS
ncbi:2-aminoethanethiol dioxygenase [Musa troglodytarum]|uniref:cysteine dioxygenase n=1 Tax=Musa troglodytarum TaxID=320322 RepID=A0A9E7HRF7_9LILI|nr:2-aminoethanethiol dioxygenase [Musa troglodytarum]